MAHEIKINGTTFTVRCFPCSGAKETLEQLLKRVITKNAEIELKKRTKSISADENIHR